MVPASEAESFIVIGFGERGEKIRNLVPHFAKNRDNDPRAEDVQSCRITFNSEL